MTTDTFSQISLYQKSIPTKAGIVRGIERIKKAFPKFPQIMLDILKDRFADNKFSDRKIIDAVNYVIDNYGGWDKLPNIAEFIQYDKKIRIYTYEEATNKATVLSPMSSLFDIVDLGLGKPVWIEKGQKDFWRLKGWGKK